ncbi:MAG: M67 family metallopeptidase [Archangium sp.]
MSSPRSECLISPSPRFRREREYVGVMRMSAGVVAELRIAAERAAPHECVGALLGTSDEVTRSLLLTNVARNPKTEFEVSARDYLHAEREAERAGLRLLGFFHSHVDAPAVPSAKDLQHAAHFELSVLVSVANGKAATPVIFHPRA